MKEIKEHKISNTLHRGLSVVPKTDGKIYVSISIGEYIIHSAVFCIVPKNVVLLKMSKVNLPLEKSLSKKYLRLSGRKCKDKFFGQPLSHPVVF